MNIVGEHAVDFPEGNGEKYFVFSPNFEKSIRQTDDQYSNIEQEVGNYWGTGDKKGIRARYCAFEYKRRNLKSPPIFKSLIKSLKDFNEMIESNHKDLFKLRRKLTFG